MQSETKYVEILKAVEFGTEESIEIPKERHAFPKKGRQTWWISQQHQNQYLNYMIVPIFH